MNGPLAKRWAHTLGAVQTPRKKRGNQGLQPVSRTQHLLHLLDNGAFP